MPISEKAFPFYWSKAWSEFALYDIHVKNDSSKTEEQSMCTVSGDVANLEFIRLMTSLFVPVEVK